MRALTAPQGPLETYGETVATAGQSPAREDTATREGRYVARQYTRDLSHRETVQTCGAKAVLAGGVRLRVNVTPEGVSAGWAGVATCGSPWVCPVCSAKIAAHRMNDLARAVAAHEATGGTLALFTVTMRHRRGQRLKTLWDGMGRAWRRLQKSGSYRRLVRSAGVVGFVRSTEVTVGDNGWHVHYHVLLFLDGNTLPTSLLTYGEALQSMWLGSVAAEGFQATRDGQDFRVFYGSGEALRQGAEYIVKSTYTPRSAAAEVAGAAYKSARHGNRTPFGVAADLVDAWEAHREPDPDDLATWEEWDRASTGRRALYWSNGLRDRLGLDEELSDEEVAALEMDGGDVLEVENPARLLRSSRVMAWVLAAAEASSTLDEARARAGDVLDGHGIDWKPTTPAGPGWAYVVKH